MKTQFSFSKRGFTLIEIMVVISIIGSLFALMSQVNFRSQEDITKAERMANKVQGILHASEVAVIMGRMKEGIATTGATIQISTSAGINWSYTSNLTGSFVPPFFDSDTKYQVYAIKGCRGALSGTTNNVTINMRRDGAIFSGVTLTADAGITNMSDTNVLEIQLKYVNMIKKVVYDKRTGRIEIRREGEIICK